MRARSPLGETCRWKASLLGTSRASNTDGAVEASSTEPEEGSEETWVAGEVTGRQRYGRTVLLEKTTLDSMQPGPPKRGVPAVKRGVPPGSKTAQAEAQNR